MGDRRRFEVFAEFILRNSKPCHVADVAGGQGYLSLILAQHGYDCTIIDPRNTNLSAPDRKSARSNHVSLRRTKCKFIAEMAQGYDLVVGLHPDGATYELCRAAKVCRTMIVPCCKMWEGDLANHGSPSLDETIRRFWRRIGIEWWETELKMSGKNRIFISQGENHGTRNSSST
jgi:hypothetical protein